MTDSPASLGTQELYFSSKTSKSAFFATPVELSGLRETEPQAELEKLGSMFARFFKRFAVDGQQSDPSTDTPTESKTPMDEATATALKALRDQLLIVTAGIDTVIEGAAADAAEPDASLSDATQEAVDEIVTTAETEREFKRKGKDTNSIAAGIARIEHLFSKLQNAPQGRDLKRTTGNADKRRVL